MVLVEYHNYDTGDNNLHWPNVEQIDIIKWVTRCLYLEIFIFLMVAMGYWHLPFTLAFAGAIGSMSYIGFLWIIKGEEREIAEINHIDVCLYFGY